MTTTEPRTFPITVPDGLWRIWSRAIHDAGMMLCVAPGHGVEVRPRHDPNRKLRGLTPGDLLSARELYVLQGMARGLANHQIGAELYLSIDTVKTHARRLFRKLGVRDRAQAVAHGFRRGLVA